MDRFSCNIVGEGEWGGAKGLHGSYGDVGSNTSGTPYAQPFETHVSGDTVSFYVYVFLERAETLRHSKLRAATAIWASVHGDLCFRLTCGHQVQCVFREEWGYTQAMIERGLKTGELRLDKHRRCFACGDQESESKQRATSSRAFTRRSRGILGPSMIGRFRRLTATILISAGSAQKRKRVPGLPSRTARAAMRKMSRSVSSVVASRPAGRRRAAGPATPAALI